MSKRYMDLVAKLRSRRAQATLSDEDEAQYVDELDRCWWAMSKAERDEVECTIGRNEVQHKAPM